MAQVKKINMDLQQAKAIENAIASTEKATATIEYVAMMADIELPENEVTNDDAQPEIH